MVVVLLPPDEGENSFGTCLNRRDTKGKGNGKDREGNSLLFSFNSEEGEGGEEGERGMRGEGEGKRERGANVLPRRPRCCCIS
jgi:hypothetical protein